jgi:hypothetical protein
MGEVLEKPVKDMNAVERWGTFFNYVSDKSKRDIINEIIECDEGDQQKRPAKRR